MDHRVTIVDAEVCGDGIQGGQCGCEIREVLRAWLEWAGLRTAGERAVVGRKTARRYVQAAEFAGLDRAAGTDAVTPMSWSAVAAVRASRPNGHEAAWEALIQEQTRSWINGTGTGAGKACKAPTLVKVHELLAQ